MAIDEYYRVSVLVRAATSYLDVFTSSDAHDIKATYRSLVRHVHPDVVDVAWRDEATELTSRLASYHRQAVEASRTGTFGSVRSDLVFQTRHAVHTADRRLTDWCDVASCYESRSQVSGVEQPSLIKIAQTRIDNDLFAAEANALELLWAGDPARAMFFPKLIESFGIVAGKDRLRANAIEWCNGFVNLEQVRAVYPDGVDPLDMAWMWRRVLWALDYAHGLGLVHGAPLPQNILIHPGMHGVVLADWCYSQKRRGNSYPPLRAIVGTQKGWYPADVLTKAPYEPWHDIQLAARTMVQLMGGDPVTGKLPKKVPARMSGYFGSIISGTASRANEVAPIATEFDELLQRLGPPYYPRVFRPFSL